MAGGVKLQGPNPEIDEDLGLSPDVEAAGKMVDDFDSPSRGLSSKDAIVRQINTPSETQGYQSEDSRDPFADAKRTSSPGGKGAEDAKDAAKKVGEEAAKKAGKKALSAAAKWIVNTVVAAIAPFLPYIAAGIAIVLGVAIIAIAIYSYYSGARGTTPVQATSMADYDWLQKLLVLNGDEEVKAALTQDTLSKLKEYLRDLNNEPAVPSEVKAKIEPLLETISSYESTPSAEKGKEIVDKLVEIVSGIGNNFPRFPVSNTNPTRKPFDNMSFNLSSNMKPHQTTRLNPAPASGHGTYAKSRNCDAADIQGRNGIPVYPVFNGTVKKSDDDFHDKQLIVIESNGYEALYAHLDPPKGADGQNVPFLEDGDPVNTNQPIGTLARGHVHFEFLYKGNCIVTTPGDEASIIKNGGSINNGTTAKAVWTHVAAILGVTP